VTESEPGGSAQRSSRWADAAIWTVVEASTRRLGEMTAETLRTGELTAHLVARLGNTGLPQKAGHLFELMHASSFNLAAIAKGSTTHAVVTGLSGEPAAAADVRLVDEGVVVAEAQAKLLCTATKTAVAQAKIKYRGMQRLVASDQIEDVNRVLDKGLTLNPDGLNFHEYADASAHVTDRLHADGVESVPVTTAEATRAAEDPVQWANRQVHVTAARQVRRATAVGAAGGAVVSGLIEAGAQAARVRAGETSAAAAASTAAGAAARGAVRSGSLAGLGEVVRVAATAGRIPKGFGVGTLPTAVATSVVGVAEAGLEFARGRIDAGEFAARSCESTLQTGMVWAFGAVGQTVLPVPVVGALLGGLVGQVSATVIARGLQIAVAAAREDGLEEERVALLEAEACAAVTAAAVLGEAERALGERHNAFVTATVGPLLEDALHAVAGGSDDSVKRLTELTASFAGKPLFCTVEEFDQWMRSPEALVLDPNARR
jgi:hypothetical protein